MHKLQIVLANLFNAPLPYWLPAVNPDILHRAQDKDIKALANQVIEVSAKYSTTVFHMTYVYPVIYHLSQTK